MVKFANQKEIQIFRAGTASFVVSILHLIEQPRPEEATYETRPDVILV